MIFFLFLASLFRLLIVAAAVVLLCVLALLPAQWAALSGKVSEFLAHPFSSWQLGAGAVVLIFVEAEARLLRLRMRRRRRFITFEGEGERIELAVSAVEDFIVKVSKGFPEIKKALPRITTSRAEVHVHLDLTLVSGHNVAQFAQEFRKNIKSQLQNILGVAKLVNVQVRVEEIEEDKIEVFRDKIFQGLEVQ